MGGCYRTPDVERAVTNLIHDDGTFRSPYADLSSQGPTITDRRLFFVTAYPNDNPYAIPNTQKTYPAVGKLDKKNYSVEELQDFVVSADNIFDVYLGETLAPFVALTPKKAVLPISKATMEVPLDHSGCKLDKAAQHLGGKKCVLNVQALHTNMRSRWEIMEKLWDANKGKNNEKSLYENLNYLSKLTSQLDYLRTVGFRATRVAYTQSGRPTAALITDNMAILDRKLYQVRCDSLDEAYYLLAVINSVTLEDAVVPFMSKGLFGVGGRDLEKHLWKLPIPKYDPDNEMHVEVSRLGEAAGKSAQERISILRDRVGDDALTMNKARNELRHYWQKDNPSCKAIEELVEELLLSG